MLFRQIFVFFTTSLSCVYAEQVREDCSAPLAKSIKDKNVPAVAAAAMLDGELVSAGATGVRKIGDTKKVTIEDKFHIGSCTKSMTAVLAATLVESGKIKWDTTLSEVFTKIKIHKGYSKVTLRQLLTNSAGVSGEIEPKLWLNLLDAKGDARSQRLKLVRGILGVKPAYEPGSKQEYSNAGFAIAGAMLESAADSTYEELLKKMVFTPLSMKTAGFRAPATNGKINQPYGHHIVEKRLVAQNPEPNGDNPRAIAPAGAVHCSVIDFAKYANFHLNLKNSILSEEALKTLHTPLKMQKYAMGWQVVTRKWADGDLLVHNGSNTMFYAIMWVVPSKNFVAVAMCNSGGKDAFEVCDNAISLLIEKYLVEE